MGYAYEAHVKTEAILKLVEKLGKAKTDESRVKCVTEILKKCEIALELWEKTLEACESEKSDGDYPPGIKLIIWFSDEQKTEVEKVYSDMKQLIAELTPDQPADETPAEETPVTVGAAAEETEETDDGE